VLAKQSPANYLTPSLCGALSSRGRSLYKNGHGVKLTEMERSIEQHYSNFAFAWGKRLLRRFLLSRRLTKMKPYRKPRCFVGTAGSGMAGRALKIWREVDPSTATSDESSAEVRDLLNSFPSSLSLFCALFCGSFRVHQPSFLTINDGLSSADPSLLRWFRQKSLLKGVHLSPDL